MNMKKLAVFLGVLGLAVFMAGTAQAAPPIRFFIGGFAEAAHLMQYQGLGFGGEIGVAVSDLISLSAEVATGSASLNYDSSSSYSTTHETVKLTMMPAIFSINFTAPLGDRVQPYVGVGLAYHSLKMTDDYTYQDTYYSGGATSTSRTDDFHALAPVFKIGLAVGITGNVKVVGEYQQIVAKDIVKRSDAYGSSETETYFGTANLKVGIRIVL
jgi:outer membrane protein W